MIKMFKLFTKKIISKTLDESKNNENAKTTNKKKEREKCEQWKVLYFE